MRGLMFKPWLKSLSNLRTRCNNAKRDMYKYYGGKGIKALISKQEIEIKLSDELKNLIKISPSFGLCPSDLIKIEEAVMI